MAYKLNFGAENLLLPTPSGAYHAACTEQPERVRRLLFMLMKNNQAADATQADIDNWAEKLDRTPEEMIELLYSMQEANFIEAPVERCGLPQGSPEKTLPPLLSVLSSSARALLCDQQGLYIANVGFAHETAEELSALAADLAALDGRHRFLINRNLGLRTNAWGLLDASGSSYIGFWPLRIGRIEFSLVISDIPYLNQVAFRDLVWILTHRYFVDE